MANHVIVGAGAVGSATAVELVDRGHDVVILSRSGGGPDRPGIQRLRLDATDAAALSAAAVGAQAIYNCVNPPYHRWPTDWPPIADALLRAAETTGAGLVTMGNLYGYGKVDGPMTETTPEHPNGVKGEVRNKMWNDALAATRAGRIRATEARASDFFGVGTGKTSYLSLALLPRAIKGKRAFMPVGDVDAPHSWSYIPDVAKTLATLGTDDRSWGEVWHVPTSPARSPRQVMADAAAILGTKAAPVSALPAWTIWTGGLFVPFLRELRETRHQFDRPFVLDSSRSQRTFGLTPTPWTEALTAAIEDSRRSAEAAAKR